MALISVVEASQCLGVSTHAIKRLLKQGKLRGQQQATPQGPPMWLVEIPDDSVGRDFATASDLETTSPVSASATAGEKQRLEKMLAFLQQQLEAKDRQIEQLHALLQQTQAPLPAPIPAAIESAN